jgi:hypothetical protein
LKKKEKTDGQRAAIANIRDLGEGNFSLDLKAGHVPCNHGYVPIEKSSLVALKRIKAFLGDNAHEVSPLFDTEFRAGQGVPAGAKARLIGLLHTTDAHQSEEALAMLNSLGVSATLTESGKAHRFDASQLEIIIKNLQPIARKRG